MRIATRKLLMYVCVSALIISVGAQRVRVIDNKGTITEVDPSKWEQKVNDIYNKNSGNVGIGTNVPQAKLHNAGSTILGSVDLTSGSIDAATVDSYSGVVVKNNTTGTITIAEPTDKTAGRIFQVSNSNTSTQTIAVGGVTLAPGSSTLFRWDGGAWSALAAASVATAANDWHLAGNSGTTPGTGAGQSFLGTTDDKELVFGTDGKERMRLFSYDSNEALGLGVTSVPGGISAWSGSSLFLGNTGNIVSSTGLDVIIDADKTSTNSTFRIRANGDGADAVDLVNVEESGNVGIGNTNPSYKLDVAGDVNLTGALRVGATAAPGTSGQILQSNGAAAPSWVSPNSTLTKSSITSSTTGVTITGTNNVLSAGTIDIATASGTQQGLLSAANWTTFNSKEPAVSTGTTSQYWRGDKTWQTLNTSVVSEGTNLYFTNARGIEATLTGFTSGAGTITSSDNILQAIQKLNGNLAALNTGVSSVSGTANRITSTGGVNPVIDIASTYVGQASITTLGTITSGTWNGAVIGSNYGGAGAVSGILKANGSGVVSAATAGTDYVVPTTTVAGFPLSSNVTLASLTAGTGLSGTAYNGSAAQTWGIDNAKVPYLSSGFSTGFLKYNGSAWVFDNSSYQTPLTFSTGLTNTSGTITVNTTQNISTLSNLTTNGLIKTSAGTGALSIATAGTDYISPNTAITGATNTKITYDSKGLVTSGGAAILASADYANQGTTTTVLHGNASGNPSWSAINLTTDVTGTLPIANGGTGATTANAALNNLLPSQATNAGKVLTTDGTNASWVASGSSNAWNLAGNTGTTPGSNFVGTIDDKDLVFKINNTESGRLGVYTASTSFGLSSTAASSGTAIGKSANAGQNGVALGTSSSTGYQATAVGYSAAAAGQSSVALGDQASASAYQSIAIGSSAKAQTQNLTIAIGVSAIASGYQSTAIGNSASATAQNSTAIGNGAVANAANTVILGNGANVGIGTSTPSTLLHVNSASSPAFRLVDGTQGTGKVLVSDANGNASWSSSGIGSGWNLTGNTGTSAGTNFVGTTDWQDLVFKINGIESGRLGVASHSTSFGFSSTASGADAVALGASASALTQNSIAIGKDSKTETNIQAIAIGYGSNVSSRDGIAIGTTAKAQTNDQSIAIGLEATATSFHGIAIGALTKAQTSNHTIAIGSRASALSEDGIAIGTKAKAETGNQSIAIGLEASATSQYGIAIGASTQATATNATAIGYNTTAPNQNTVILGTGANVGIGTNNPQNKLEITQGTAGNSGLRLTNLPSTTTPIVNPGTGVLSVNSTGDVILVPSAALNGTGYVKQNGTTTSYVSAIPLATDVTGVLPLANGGTNANLTAVNGGVVWSNGTQMQISAAGTAGQILKSNGAAAPTWVSGIPINNLLAATGTNTIDNTTYAQTWNWTGLATGAGLTINSNSNSSTNGIFKVANTSGSGTGVVAAIQSNSTAGSGVTVLANGNVGIGYSNPVTPAPPTINNPTSASPTTLAVNGIVDAPIYTSNVQGSTTSPLTGNNLTWNVSLGSSAVWQLSAGANILTLSNAKAGMYGVIIVKNAGTSTLTFASGTNKVINGGGGVPTLTQAAGAFDILSFFYDGTTYWWTIGNNYN